MALFWRIWIAVCVVNLLVLLIFVTLSTLQFQGINAELVGERLRVLAERTAAPFDSAAKIGLPLSTVRNAGALLERARQTDDAIDAIHIYDQTGRVVHSTEEGAPENIPPEAFSASQGSVGAWLVETPDRFLSGRRVPEGEGPKAGGVLIVYPLRTSVTQTRAMLAELGLSALMILALVGAVSWLPLRLALRRQVAQFDEIEASVHAFERDAWRSAAGAPPPDGLASDDFRGRLDDAENRYRQAGHDLRGPVSADKP